MPNHNTLRFHVHSHLQQISILLGETLLWQTSISTASRGLGETEGSYQTPRGLHHIAEKIGEGLPLGTVFQHRQPTGTIWTPADPLTDDDKILTRILWLAGDEPSNQNTYQRFIYIHGTNHEEKIGTPASHGCIRLNNADMLRLFDEASVGTPIFIE